MRRREFITVLGGTAAAAWAAHRPRTTARPHLSPGHIAQPRASGAPVSALYDELRRLGFVEGQNLIVDGRGYAVRTEQFPAVAAELIRANVDAILCGGPAAARAAQEITRTTPILTLTDDMVGQGLVASLARPCGN
jgi:putative ABC transport system substrate-binding protein